MRIQHNIAAMNSYRNLSSNNKAVAKNLEKLSSGYRINRAGDDAAGLAISEKMRAQVTGLKTAQKNAKDGISLIQTAEGALTEVHSMLNRMVELADQSANGTFDDSTDRNNLQKEFDALRGEIDRISKATNFNGINLLDGTQKVSKGTAALLVDRLAALDKNGVKPNAASKGSITVTLDDPTIKIGKGHNAGAAAGATDVTLTESAATATEYSIGALTQGGGAGETIELEFAYSDAEGTAVTGKKLNITTGATAADTFEAIKTAVANDADLKDLFEVTGDATGVKITNKEVGAASQAEITGLKMENKGTGGVALGTAKDAVADVVTDTVTNKTNAVAQNDTITLAGKTYTVGAAGSTTSNTNIDLNDAGSVDALITAAIGLLNGDNTAEYSAAYDATSGEITYTAKTAGAVAGAGPATGASTAFVLADTATAGGATSVSSANTTPGAEAVTATGGTSTAGKDAALDISSLINDVGDTITINDKTYTFAAAADPDSREFTNLTELKAQLLTDGVVLEDKNSTNDGTAVAFKAAAVKAEGAAVDDIITGTTTYKDLADMALDGKKLSDHFDIKVDGVTMDITDATTTFAAGAEITFEAKTPGKLSDTVMNGLNFTSGADVTKMQGNDEGKPSNASKTEYELTFDISKLAGGQSFSIGNTAGKSKTFELTLDGTVNTDGAIAINIAGMDPATAEGKLAIAKAIETAVGTEMGATFETKDPKAADINGNNFKLTMTAKDPGAASNLGAVRVSESASATGAISGSYQAASAAVQDTLGTFAEVSYTLDLNKLAAGDKIDINGTEIEIVADADEDLGSGKIGLTNAKDAGKLVDAFEANGFASGKLSISDGKLTIKGTAVGETAKDLAAGSGKVAFTSKSTPQDTGGLTLQIGDTSDDYNQLTVSIGNMDCESLGIDTSKINIDQQGNAAASVEILKNAINSVSSTRGDLGALQNRLEHTINNLSVMTENIQDAESTIRDVDVAEEMMAYTKNNILVQSSQAMLAQANQLPQGVLQLLG